jgi:hypothetical protein
MPIVCPGCHKSYTTTAWSHHLFKSRRPECRAIYEQQQSYLPGANPSDEEMLSDSGDRDGSPKQFQGDFFGNDYDSDDFPGWDADGDSIASSADADEIRWNDDRSDFDNDSSESESDSESDSSSDGSDVDIEPPPVPAHATTSGPTQTPDPDPMDDERGRPLTAEERRQAEEDVWVRPVVQEFPGRAGEVIDESVRSGYEGYKSQIGADAATNPYAPFESKLDWEFAKWAKLRGPGSTAVTELMGIDDVCSNNFINIINTELILSKLHEKLGLSYKNSRELNKIVDSLPSRPKFRRKELLVGDEVLEMYHRDVLECVRALYGDPEFAPHLIFKPERHYMDEDQTKRAYSDVHTGKWWWETQVYKLALSFHNNTYSVLESP